MGITDTQSFSWVIRDVFFAAIAPLPFFASFTKRRCKQFQVQAAQLPYLGVYIIDETMTPDGDGNAGYVRFVHTLRVGFSVIIQNNDPVASEQKLDEAFWLIMNTLWRDPYLMNLLDTTNPSTGTDSPDNTRIESIERGTRKHVWGNSSLNNETPIAELQYDVSCRYRAGYEPVITDDLLRIHVETVPLADDDTVPPVDQVQRIISEYEFTPSPLEAKP
jgi:hypothetical protein